MNSVELAVAGKPKFIPVTLYDGMPCLIDVNTIKYIKKAPFQKDKEVQGKTYIVTEFSPQGTFEVMEEYEKIFQALYDAGCL